RCRPGRAGARRTGRGGRPGRGRRDAPRCEPAGRDGGPRISGATYTWNRRPGLIAAGRAGELFVGSGSLYLVDGRSGVVTTTDPTSLAVRGRQSLAARVGPDGGVVDAARRLWLIDAITGNLVWLDGTARHDRRAVSEPARTRLVLAGGHPAIVDLAEGRITPVSAGGRLERLVVSALTRWPDGRTLTIGSRTTDAGPRPAALLGDRRGTHWVQVPLPLPVAAGAALRGRIELFGVVVAGGEAHVAGAVADGGDGSGAAVWSLPLPLPASPGS
ncbi:hypothetical protein ND748_30940, partial [Frankia sp. AiPs1]|nr:hypothetical protein [Frankia sp. AiPs1]